MRDGSLFVSKTHTNKYVLDVDIINYAPHNRNNKSRACARGWAEHVGFIWAKLICISDFSYKPYQCWYMAMQDSG